MSTPTRPPPARYWWVRFHDVCDGEVVIDLGAAVVIARSLVQAVHSAWRCGFHPGGAAAGWALPADLALPDDLIDRLLPPGDVCEAEILISQHNNNSRRTP